MIQILFGFFYRFPVPCFSWVHSSVEGAVEGEERSRGSKGDVKKGRGKEWRRRCWRWRRCIEGLRVVCVFVFVFVCVFVGEDG